MKINNEPKLDFEDVLLVPQRTKTVSRANIKLERNFSFYHSNSKWSGIPIFSANMDTTGTFAMSQSLMKFNIATCLHKHYEDIKLIQDLTELDYQWYSMGIKDDDFTKLNKFVESTQEVPNLCIDVANGYTDDFVNFCARVRDEFGKEPIIMAGNVCTPEMVQEIILHGGVDIVKIGIGPGSACTTRLKTGVGYPQLSAMMECAHAAHGLRAGDGRLGLICADGGCRNPSDIVKAFAAGADFVMLGGMLAGTDECEGEWDIEYKTRIYDSRGAIWQSNDPGYPTETRKKALKFYGMSSHEAQSKYGGIKDYRSSEGRVLSVKYKGGADSIMSDILGGIRSACAYTGATCLKDFSKTARFVTVNRVHYNTQT
jgi:GMP reductase